MAIQVPVLPRNCDSETGPASQIRVHGFESESKFESKSAENRSLVGLESMAELEYYITWSRENMVRFKVMSGEAYDTMFKLDYIFRTFNIINII